MLTFSHDITIGGEVVTFTSGSLCATGISSVACCTGGRMSPKTHPDPADKVKLLPYLESNHDTAVRRLVATRTELSQFIDFWYFNIFLSGPG